MNRKSGHVRAGLLRRAGADASRRSTRRAFLIVALGAGFFAAPLATYAQQRGKVWRIGFFYFGSRQSASESGRRGLFLQGMRDLGYVEGRNLILEERYAEGISERVSGIVAELMRLKVDVIVAAGTPVYHALQKATRTIPIVVTVTADPVGDGLAASLARPGGNITGLSTGTFELFPKHVELMKAAVPRLSRVAVLWNSSNDAHPARVKEVQSIARKVGLQTVAVDGRTAGDIERGFATMTRERAEAVIIINDTFFVQQLRQIAELAVKHKLPSIYGGIEYAESGGFMGYGQNISDNFRRAASYVDKILKGRQPGELPIEQPTRLTLAINRKTAKALGLTIPQELLLRADKVIE